MRTALGMSWELLNAQVSGCIRHDARQMLMWMVACQGDDKSWQRQREMLIKKLYE